MVLLWDSDSAAVDNETFTVREEDNLLGYSDGGSAGSYYDIVWKGHKFDGGWSVLRLQR